MVYMFLADGFEEIEVFYPLDVLRRCGVEVATVGVFGEYATSTRGVTVKADVDISEVKKDNKLSMIILPGGNPGYTNLSNSKAMLDIIEYCDKFNVYIAAICGAPTILGKLGLLRGKSATCYPGLEKDLSGAKYVNKPVVIDGKIITSQAAGTSEKFAFAIAEILAGKAKSAEVYKTMLCGK
ncbi:MAG: DJ-1/PfpI family protein [Oscillospiraceae bacterium]|nr:DJ-1/PfpI family protein [Oscillospiraceae bacterium]